MDTRRASSSLTDPASPASPSARTRAAPVAANREPVIGRVVAIIVAVALLTPLVLATFIIPSPSGHGTHEQLGMPACGWALYFGKPCITCGMTTAFAHAVRGHLLIAATTQPMGLAIALACGVGFWGAMHTAITGSAVLESMGRWLVRPRIMWSIAGLLLLAWGWTWTHWTS